MGKQDTAQALAMLNALASVGATTFDITLLDSEGKEHGFQRNRSLDELRRSIARRLAAAIHSQHSLVIRPRSSAALLIQLDDFDERKAAATEPYAFMTLHTSPGNCQVWLAVSDGPKETDKAAARLFRTRVRRGAGADQSATGATRIAGSLNVKTKYAPDFPVVTLGQVNAGRTITTAALEQAGLIDRAEPFKTSAPPSSHLPPAGVPPRILPPPRPTAARTWPDYQLALRGAPLKADGTGPDRSRADFMFCKWAIERGHGVEETAVKLAEVSAKAQERIRVKDDRGYALLTARNAAGAVERERTRAARL